jgi:hypothetical protein
MAVTDKRAAFLAALAGHGHVGRALATSGMSSSGLQRAKQSTPAFRAALETARQQGRAAVAAGLVQCGEGEAIWGQRIGRPRLVTITGHKWTPDAERAFIETLSATCNVTQAARAAGFSQNAAYDQRRASPRLRADWQAAIDEAVLRLNAKLIRQATNGVIRDEGDDGTVRARIADDNEDGAIEDTQLAVNLLKEHAARRAGTRQSGASLGRGHVDIEAFRRRVMAQLAALKHARTPNADPATDEA